MNEVDNYIAKFPDTTKSKLDEIRSVIKTESPQLKESLKWGNLAYSNGTIMFILAGYKNHVGFHVTKTVIEKLKNNLVAYQTTPGSVKFPLSEPIPTELIKDIILTRLNEYEKQGVLWK
jgi:uncharacterized protein YdhG (YjbR/CyaY superfamily)